MPGPRQASSCKPPFVLPDRPAIGAVAEPASAIRPWLGLSYSEQTLALGCGSCAQSCVMQQAIIMSSQPPSLAAAAMPVVATASTSASASASASSTSPQIPSPSSSPHSSSSSDTVTCAPSASSPSPGTASAHDSHHRVKGLERLVLNGKPFMSTQARAHSKKFCMPHRARICPIPQRQKRQQSKTRHCPLQRPSLLSVPHSKSRDPVPRPDPASSHFISPYTLPFSFSVFSATICGQQLVSTTSSMCHCYTRIQAPRLPRHASAGT